MSVFLGIIIEGLYFGFRDFVELSESARNTFSKPYGLKLNMVRASTKLLSDNLLEVIISLVGLFILQFILSYTLSFIPYNDFSMLLLRYSPWIGKTIFGIVLVFRIGKNKLVAVAIGILATMIPIGGVTFYLLTKTINLDHGR